MRVIYLYYGCTFTNTLTERERKKNLSDNTEETRYQRRSKEKQWRHDIRFRLLFGEGDLHRRVGRDLEALERVSGRGRLYFVLELDEGDVVSAGDQANLFEAGELQTEDEQRYTIQFFIKTIS